MNKIVKTRLPNYEKKIWGGQLASLSLFNSYYLPLKYGLKAIKNIKGRVLDVGCGGGAYTAALKYYRPDLTLIGLDMSRECIHRAREKHPAVKFIPGKVTSLPFGSNNFDAVLSNHLLEHLASIPPALQEVNRVLKPGAIFFSSLPLEDNWSALVKWLRKLVWFKSNRLSYLGHQQAINKNDYLQLLGRAGFAIKDISWSGFF